VVDTVGGVSTTQQTRSLPVTMSLAWAGHVTTNFGYDVSRSTSNQAGSLTRNDRNDASANLAFAFRPPYQLLPLKSDIRTTLGYSSSSTRGCLTLADAPGCTPIMDASRQQYNFSMDTDMPPNVSAGLSVGYILTTDAYLDRKFAQLVLTASVTVNFRAGQPR